METKYKHSYYYPCVFLGTITIGIYTRDLYFSETFDGQMLLSRRGDGLLDFDAEEVKKFKYNPLDEEGFFDKAYLLAKEKGLI